jgi:opacity protein-like surface antigen
MKRLLVAGASVLAMAMAAGAADAMKFVYTGMSQRFTVPEAGDDEIEAFGAQGGTGAVGVDKTGKATQGGPGGKGAEAEAQFEVVAGRKLTIIVGQAGENGAYQRAGPYAGGGGRRPGLWRRRRRFLDQRRGHEPGLEERRERGRRVCDHQHAA